MKMIPFYIRELAPIMVYEIIFVPEMRSLHSFTEAKPLLTLQLLN